MNIFIMKDSNGLNSWKSWFNLNTPRTHKSPWQQIHHLPKPEVMTEVVHPCKQQFLLTVSIVTTHAIRSKQRGNVHVFMYESLNMPA